MASQRNAHHNHSLRTQPVRAGDVFRYDETRLATVMSTLPGGRAQLRISGLRNGKPSISVGEDKVSQIKQWQRLGRAAYLDGAYLPVNETDLARRA